MRRPSVAALAILVIVAVCLLVARDRQQQKRLDALSGQLEDLSMVTRGLALPLQTLPALLGQLHCKLDPNDLSRLAGVATGKAGPPATASPAVVHTEKIGPTELSYDQVAALDRAQRRLEEALSRRLLSQADVLEIRAQLVAGGSPQAAEKLRARIASAINRKELVPEQRPFILP